MNWVYTYTNFDLIQRNTIIDLSNMMMLSRTDYTNIFDIPKR